jgi:hypothetical protein
VQGNLEEFSVSNSTTYPREHNEEANRLAQSASGYRENQEVFAMEVCAFGSDLAEDVGEKILLIILKIHPERFLGSLGTKL